MPSRRLKIWYCTYKHAPGGISLTASCLSNSIYWQLIQESFCVARWRQNHSEVYSFLHVMFSLPLLCSQFYFLKPGLASPWNTLLWTKDTTIFLLYQLLLHLASTGTRGREGVAQEQIFTCLPSPKEWKDFDLLSVKQIHLRFHVLNRDCALSQNLETAWLHSWRQ